MQLYITHALQFPCCGASWPIQVTNGVDLKIFTLGIWQLNAVVQRLVGAQLNLLRLELTRQAL